MNGIDQRLSDKDKNCTCELRFDAVGREGGHFFRRAVKENDVDDIITNVSLPFQLSYNNNNETIYRCVLHILGL